MRFRKFIIRHYRAVHQAEVSVGQTLIPLIGINESGKTSLLQAILAFDRLSDKVNGQRHLEYKNKYQLGDRDCTVSAEVLLDVAADLDAISSRLKLPRGHALLTQLEAVFNAKRTITITRNLRTRDYSVVGVDATESQNRQLAKTLYRLLPLILYFDDFTDRVPEAVRFVLAENDVGYTLKKSKDVTWQRMIEEVFRRASGQRYRLGDFIKMEDPDERDSLLSDIQDELNKEIMDDWRRLRAVSPSLADDPGDLTLELRYQATTQGFKFEFKVQDRSSDKGRFFNVIDRSKGFQWYFNFLMKLKFNPKYQEEQSGAIYLLDEPGSYLHSSAQEELLRALKVISTTNTIIYCTHSQHLLDPDVINIGQTRIVSKERGVIQVMPFGSAGKENYQGALTPLYNALHLRTGAFNRPMKRVAICEGITDYYFFSMLLRLSEPHALAGIDLLPGAGAGQLKELISMAIAWADDYLVLLDSDRAGNQAFTKYEEFFGSQESSRFVRYSTPQQSSDVQLEDFLSQDDKERILTLTGARTIKASFAELYHGPADQQREMFAALDPVTVSNLSVTWPRLQALAELPRR
jgi:hypothetical protein